MSILIYVLCFILQINTTTALSFLRVTPGSSSFTAVIDGTAEFGRGACDAGDIDNNGVRDLAIGAPASAISAVDYGALYILFLDGDHSVMSFQIIAAGDIGGFGEAETYSLGHDAMSTGDLDEDGRYGKYIYTSFSSIHRLYFIFK